jgi:hypothetical protein
MNHIGKTGVEAVKTCRKTTKGNRVVLTRNASSLAVHTSACYLFR